MPTDQAIDFEHRHPEWQRFEARWRMAQSFWLGGVHILEPDYFATSVGTWVRDVETSAENPEPSDSQPNYQWTTTEARSFIWKHERETLSEYGMRQERITNLPLFQYIVNTLSAGVLRNKPPREGVSGEWEKIHKDVDLVGSDIDAFMRRALAMALVFGRVHGVTDKPAFPEPAVSAGQQMDRDERVYAYLVNPIDLVDWAVDDRGRFLWTVIRENGPDPRMPGHQPEPLPDQYRVRYPDHWELWREPTDEEAQQRAGEKWILDSEGPLNGIGISTLYATKTDQVAHMGIETPLADFLDFNRYTINKLSELDEVDRLQAFSQLAIPVMDGSIGAVEVSPHRYFGYPSEAGAPSYISPDSSLPQGKYERIMDGMNGMRQLAGVSRGKAENSKEERSAAALTVETEDKKNQLAWWSKALNEFDEALHRDFKNWGVKGEPPTALYPTNYDVKATMTRVSEAVQLIQGIPLMQEADEAQKAVVTPILREMLVDTGLTMQETDDVIATLDDAIKAKEEAKLEDQRMKEEAMKMKAQQPDGGAPPFGKKPGFAPPKKPKGTSNADL